MEKPDFRPDGVTGGGDREDMFYRMSITGPNGAHFHLLEESHHSESDIRKTKAYLRRHHDVVSIHVVKESDVVLKK